MILETIGDNALRCQRGEVPIDYERRRVLASTTELISRTEWAAVTVASGCTLNVETYQKVHDFASCIFAGERVEDLPRKATWPILTNATHEFWTRLVQILDTKLEQLGLDEPLVWDPVFGTHGNTDAVDLSLRARRLFQEGETLHRTAAVESMSAGALVVVLVMTAREVSNRLPPSPSALPLDWTIDDVASRYSAGASAREIGFEIGLSDDRVLRLLHVLCVERPPRKLKHLIDKQWLTNKSEVMTLKEIAKELHAGATTVERAARRHNIPARRGTPSHKSSLDAAATHAHLAEPLRTVMMSPNGRGRVARLVLMKFFVSYGDLASAIGANPSCVSTQVSLVEDAVGAPLIVRARLHDAIGFTSLGDQLATQAAEELGVSLPSAPSKEAARVLTKQGLRALNAVEACVQGGTIRQGASCLNRPRHSVARTISRWQDTNGVQLLRWDSHDGPCVLTPKGRAVLRELSDRPGPPAALMDLAAPAAAQRRAAQSR